MIDLRNITFGGTAATVASMGLIVGLGAAATPRSAIVGSLLIVAFADNLTDALSIHLYQEAERLPERKALRTTVTNYVVRLCTALSFVVIAAFTPQAVAVPATLAWGFLLLGWLSYRIAKARAASVVSEIGKHCAAAMLVILASRLIGVWIGNLA